MRINDFNNLTDLCTYVYVDSMSGVHDIQTIVQITEMPLNKQFIFTHRNDKTMKYS